MQNEGNHPLLQGSEFFGIIRRVISDPAGDFCKPFRDQDRKKFLSKIKRNYNTTSIKVECPPDSEEANMYIFLDDFFRNHFKSAFQKINDLGSALSPRAAYMLLCNAAPEKLEDCRGVRMLRQKFEGDEFRLKAQACAKQLLKDFTRRMCNSLNKSFGLLSESNLKQFMCEYMFVHLEEGYIKELAEFTSAFISPSKMGDDKQTQKTITLGNFTFKEGKLTRISSTFEETLAKDVLRHDYYSRHEDEDNFHQDTWTPGLPSSQIQFLYVTAYQRALEDEFFAAVEESCQRIIKHLPKNYEQVKDEIANGYEMVFSTNELVDDVYRTFFGNIEYAEAITIKTEMLAAIKNSAKIWNFPMPTMLTDYLTYSH